MKKNFLKTLFFFPIFTIACFCSSEMSLEEKIGQLLVVQFRGDQINERATFLIKDLHVGGFIFYQFANKLTSPEQVKKLTTSLQNEAKNTRLKIPLIICVDQEGGLINHLNVGFTHFPGNRSLTVSNEPILAKLSAYATAVELKRVGINMNLTPVVDVNTNPKNPVIGIRSFDSSAEKVIEFAKQALDGYHMGGIITCLKHFPGHGDVEIDSHFALPVLKKTKKNLAKCELLPFSELAKDAVTIMTAHLLVPSIDEENCATFSKKILDILRDEMHYQGIIVSDSLGMNGFLTNCASRGDAAIKAINAGCDLLILGGSRINIRNTQEIYHSLLDAAYSGEIPLERIDEAVKKVLALKQTYLLEDKKDIDVNLAEHRALARRIAKKALVVQKTIPLQNPTTLSIFAPNTCDRQFKECLFDSSTNTYFFDEYFPTKDPYLLHIAQNSDLLLIFLYNTWKSKGQIEFVQTLINTKKPIFLITVKDPIDADLFSDQLGIIHTFSPTTFSIQAAYDTVLEMIPKI